VWNTQITHVWICITTENPFLFSLLPGVLTPNSVLTLFLKLLSLALVTALVHQYIFLVSKLFKYSPFFQLSLKGLTMYI